MRKPEDSRDPNDPLWDRVPNLNGEKDTIMRSKGRGDQPKLGRVAPETDSAIVEPKMDTILCLQNIGNHIDKAVHGLEALRHAHVSTPSESHQGGGLA